MATSLIRGKYILRHLQRGADPPPMAPARASQDPLAWSLSLSLPVSDGVLGGWSWPEVRHP